MPSSYCSVARSPEECPQRRCCETLESLYPCSCRTALVRRKKDIDPYISLLLSLAQLSSRELDLPIDRCNVLNTASWHKATARRSTSSRTRPQKLPEPYMTQQSICNPSVNTLSSSSATRILHDSEASHSVSIDSYFIISFSIVDPLLGTVSLWPLPSTKESDCSLELRPFVTLVQPSSPVISRRFDAVGFFLRLEWGMSSVTPWEMINLGLKCHGENFRLLWFLEYRYSFPECQFWAFILEHLTNLEQTPLQQIDNISLELRLAIIKVE